MVGLPGQNYHQNPPPIYPPSNRKAAKPLAMIRPLPANRGLETDYKRESFSLDEKNLLEELIRKLFDDPEARKIEYSLRKFPEAFPGKISFNM